MKRWLLLIGLLLVSTLAFAADPSQFYKLFQPSAQDLSVWYLGNIFGSELVPGDRSSGVRLLSVLFGIFNQIALTVGIIIIVYTALAGTLNTAHEGKPLGDKWNSVWMPVRISVGIALLVPKGGTGYCLAQSLVMWLTLQGVGAADTVWNAMIEYFAQGGAIYSNETSQDSNYMITPNVQYAYSLEGSNTRVEHNDKGIVTPAPKLLKNMVCIAVFNNNPDAVALNKGYKYEAYTRTGVYDTVFFGDRTAGMNGTGGSECGSVQSVAAPEGCDNAECMQNRLTIYTNANWNMAKGLEGIANAIVTDPDDAKGTWDSYYSSVKTNAELYINYLVGYEDILFDKKAAGEALKESKAFETYKKYGWILAGNYYTVLSGFKERVNYMLRTFRPANPMVDLVPVPVPTDPTSPNAKPYQNADDFFADFEEYGDPMSLVTADQKMKHGKPVMDKYGNPVEISSAVSTRGKTNKKGKENKNASNQHNIGPVDMDEILSALGGGAAKSKEASNMKQTGKKKKNTRESGKKKGAASGSTESMVKDYLRYLTGEGSGSGDLRVAKDPILRASNYGKSLTEAAAALLPVLATALTLIAAFQYCTAVHAEGYIIEAAGNLLIIPLISLFVFMYAQGAMLGVFIPMIPYITFFIGVVGWMLQVVEAVAAAPLVAIGLVFPETRDEIWGKAAPAYMLILGLFLRPSLMLVGFAAAMMVLWVLTELLNIGFLMLTVATFRIEDAFGFVVIMMAYTGIFTVVVTKSYSLINVVPNKVLSWIGDTSMGVTGAEEAISAGKQGVEAGAGAVSGGLKNQGDTAAISRGMKDYGEKKEGNKAAADANKTPKPGKTEE